jgi:Cu+-exporting ATPase
MLDANEPLDAPACTSPDGRISRCAGSSGEPSTPHEHHQVEPAAAPSGTVIDPVCGMKVNPATAAHSVTVNGRTTSFCSLPCKRTFLAGLTDGGTP